MDRENIKAIVENSLTPPEREQPPPTDLVTALARAQGVIENARFDRKNTHFGNKYTTIAALRDVIRTALSDNAIAITQTIEYRGEPERPYLFTALRGHGEVIGSHYALPVGQKDQVFGSALTYARRYSAGAILFLASDEDDDAELAMQAAEQVVADGELLSNEQTAEIMELIQKTKTKIADFLKYFDAPSLGDLPAKQYATAKAKLEAKLEAKLKAQTPDKP